MHEPSMQRKRSERESSPKLARSGVQTPSRLVVMVADPNCVKETNKRDSSDACELITLGWLVTRTCAREDICALIFNRISTRALISLALSFDAMPSARSDVRI